ncbi:o-succinylbenzoate synthase [Actinobacillus genomosp. 2]|uniref:o-succinylbenzoate synthase n=1 Tax=Actinobacillus genomosp. 2 TaxID=230709 RepID=UPI00244333C7|nr:o-succinylbenzoate synthase [Actinobacillus genomosp. 2]WGE32697.1 o-succinylbenzoate synthase [Actinobacillus genomosp. 2]
MKQAKLYRYQLPVETGVILRNRRLKQREGLIVVLQVEDKMGLGEIAPLPEFSIETLDEAEKQAKIWIDKWSKEQADYLDNYSPSVAFGLSCALAELNGELGEQGNYRAAVLCYGDPDELYTELNAIEGEKVGKMKVGLYEANRDGLIANMLLDALPDLQLRLDANRGWTLEKAVKFSEKIASEHKSRIQFIEEPCKTPELSRQFAQESGIAIAWDESVREADFVVKNEPNVTAIVIKPTLVGSLQKCICLIEQAHQQGLIAVISSSIESSLALTQLARFAQQYTPQTTPGLDTLDLMQHQLLRVWNNSNLPIVNLDSPFVQEIML